MTTAGQIIRAGTGLVLGAPAGCRDRFLIDSDDTGGRFSLLEHLFRTMGTADADVDLGPLVASYECEGDPAATEPIVRRYGLRFG